MAAGPLRLRDSQPKEKGPRGVRAFSFSRGLRKGAPEGRTTSELHSWDDYVEFTPRYRTALGENLARRDNGCRLQGVLHETWRSSVSFADANRLIAENRRARSMV